MQHRSLSFLLSPGLVVLAGCPVEQTYADFIDKYGGTYSSESASHSGSGSAVSDGSSGDPSTPTSTTVNSGASAEAGESSESGLTTEAGLSTGLASSGTTDPWVDEVPVLGAFTISPNPVLAAGFVELSADCSDDVGVIELRFLVDEEVIAAVTEAPFSAKWLVKSQVQAGDHTLAVECEDTAGHVVSTAKPVSVTLPATGSVAWSQVHAAFKGNAEAADASAAPDGSWWVCGLADNVGGGTGIWVAHYSAAGEKLFNRVISRGKDQNGRCGGIAVASEDGHRAVLTGNFGPAGLLLPSLWVGLIDEIEVNPVLAESNDALSGYSGNGILINKYGQFEIAGQRFVGGKDWDMFHRVYNHMPGKKELTSSVGLTYGDPDVIDIASAIVENLDGTVTLIGTRTRENQLRAAAVKLDAQHQVDFSGSWPFVSPLVGKDGGAGAFDGSVDSAGNLLLAGWRRQDPKTPSQIMTLKLDPQGSPLGGAALESDKNWPDDNVGLGVAHLSDGTFVVTASVTAGWDDHDIWLRRYPAQDAKFVFQGPYGLLDEPRRVRTNVFDQVLVVGFETVVVMQDGKLAKASRAWLGAFN
jgi:hypothetical protein